MRVYFSGISNSDSIQCWLKAVRTNYTNNTCIILTFPTYYMMRYISNTTRRVPVQRAVERDEIPYPNKVHDTTLHSRA